MSRHRIVLSLVLSVFCAAEARPQAVEIDHKAVGCIVVGKYPKMNACFTPAANLARGRVYFRPEGTPSWYYVDMKSDQPCFTGILPRPGKKLVGKKIEYYVEGQDKTFNAGRTAEFAPVVVNNAQECKKDVPVAPALNNATVAVFPALPAGFVGGGLGTAAVVGIAAAGAAAAGTAAVVASNDNGTTTTTVAIGGGNTTTTIAAATTTTTTTTTTPRAANRAPFAVLSTSPNPPSGQSPLSVTFDLCKSTDPDGDSLSFFFDFGDGNTASGSCVESHTYQATFRATSAGVKAQDATYTATARVSDPGGLSAERSRNVEVGSPAANCATPTVVLSPPPDQVDCSPVFVRARTTDADGVTLCAVPASFTSCNTFDPRSARGQASSTSAARGEAQACVNAARSGSNFSANVPLSDFGCFRINAEARNDCGNTDTSPPRFVFNFDRCGSDLTAARKGDDRTAVWSSDLAVDGGRLQVVVNGGSPAFPGRGRGFGSARLADGENRVEAVLVESAGKPGLWRIDLKPSEAIVAGSLRVITGEVVLLGPASATFRLSGAQGERVVFTFLKK